MDRSIKMDVRMKCLGTAALGICFLSNVASAASPQVTWLSEDGGTKVHVATCSGDKLCARLVWLHHPIDPSTGKPKTDKRNPDPSKRGRPLIGLEVVHALAPSGPNTWSGVIYNADDGHTYKASLEVASDEVAKLKGCVLAVICKSHIWTRAN